MLKNELEILATSFIPWNGAYETSKKEGPRHFRNSILESCGKAKEAWAAAAFSENSNDTLRRYFNFHFRFLCGQIDERCHSGQQETVIVLCQLMDYLLEFYKGFIDQQQSVSRQYISYHMRSLQPRFQLFQHALQESSVDDTLKKSLKDSLSQIYTGESAESMELGALFYREELIAGLSVVRENPQLMTTEYLVSELMKMNFNHFLFFSFLREQATITMRKNPGTHLSQQLMNLHAAIPALADNLTPSFDSKWPHIAVMYKSWLQEYSELVALSIPTSYPAELTTRVPLNISVKQLACMIRSFYASGFYGNVSLTKIFEHAALVFTTKRQQHISAESLSNAYYEVDYSSALKTMRIFNQASEFLKSYCFPA